MKKKEMINYLRENMPVFTGTPEEQEIKKSLYIYTELGKAKSFDERYYFGNSDTQRKIYDLAQKQRSQPDELAKKRKIICVSLTHLYINILNEFGIKARASEPEEGGHINPFIMPKNKKFFVADLQLDLENIQTRSRLQHFEYQRNNQEEITKMLIEMGYIKDEKDYKNEVISKLRKKVNEAGSHQGLKTILENDELYLGNEQMDIVEINKFYRGVIKKTLPNYYNKKIFAFNCYKKVGEERDYTLCMFSHENDSVRPYIFSKKARKFASVDLETMRKLQEEGLVLGVRQKENGVNLLKKYINNEVVRKDKEK